MSFLKIPSFLTNLLRPDPTGPGEARIDGATGEWKYNPGAGEVVLSEYVPGAGPLTRAGQFRIDGSDLVYYDGASEQTIAVGGGGAGATNVTMATTTWTPTSTGNISIAHGAAFTPTYIIAHLTHDNSSGAGGGQPNGLGMWDYNGGAPIQRGQTNAGHATDCAALVTLNGITPVGNHFVKTAISSTDATNVNVNRINGGTNFLNPSFVMRLTLACFG